MRLVGNYKVEGLRAEVDRESSGEPIRPDYASLDPVERTRFSALNPAEKDRDSTIDDGENTSFIPYAHCFRSIAGTTRRMRQRRSARRCTTTMAASIVLPNPTSSASIAPFKGGNDSANNAASTWCGFMSTRAVDNDCASVDSLSPSRIRRCG